MPVESSTAAELSGVHPSDRWSTAEHLLAAAVDALRGANWQRAGDKRKPQPKPVPRPGPRGPARAPDVEKIDRILAMPRVPLDGEG